MATSAVAQETVFALRRQIAKIEGCLADRLEAPAGDGVVLRRNGVASAEGSVFATGASALDSALGGGLPRAALTEIHGAETRDAAAVAGFACALACLQPEASGIMPLLWIGTSEVFREAGHLYAPGLLARFGLRPEQILLSEASRIEDALWVAEEAARLAALSMVVLEIRGNPSRLDLTATRRLHRRAQEAGRPVLLLRQAARAEPTAAPVRLVVSPAGAGRRRTLSGPLDGSIGPPAFTVAIGKSRSALPGQFVVEWNSDERVFSERRTAHPVPVVSLSRGGKDPAAAAGAVVAFPSDAAQPPGDQPSRQEHAAHRRARRTG